MVAPKSVKWFVKGFSTSVAASAIASIVVAFLTYYVLSENLTAIVKKSLDIIKFDDSVSILNDVASHQVSPSSLRPMAHRDALSEVAGIRRKLGQVYEQLSVSLQEIDTLIAAMHRLPIDDRPTKLFDDKLVPSPRSEFNYRLASRRNALAQLSEGIADLQRDTDSMEQMLNSMDAAYLHAASEQIGALTAQVERARASLVERRNAMLEVLEEFAD